MTQFRGAGERGFTLVEVLVATAVFVFVAVAGFETLRQLGTSVTLLADRAHAQADLNAALAHMRSDALAASAVWIPNAPCGNVAVSMLRRDASGTSFTTYVARDGALVRAHAAGPIDPCSNALALDTVLPNVTSVSANALPAPGLAGGADGALFHAAAIPSVVVDAHVADYDGSSILTGNRVVDVTLDADPVASRMDLIAGNRPGGYTVALAYTCGARCQANGANSTASFPEVRGLDVTTCTPLAPDLPDTSAYYQAAATGLNGRGQIVVTQYALHLRYGYTFAGGSSPPLTVYRIGATFVWPPAATLADAYPVDYLSNAVKANLAAIVATAPASGLAGNDAVCATMDTEHDYRG